MATLIIAETCDIWIITRVRACVAYLYNGHLYDRVKGLSWFLKRLKMKEIFV